MASLHGEVGTSDLAGDRQQLPELHAVSGPPLPEDNCGLMATADCQTITTTSGVPRIPAVISRFDGI